MDALTNPYTPNAGAEPVALVGRDNQLESFDLLLARLEAGRTEQSMIVTGLRGVGKTVLLGRFRNKALDHGWVVVEIEVSKHDDAEFRRNLALRMRSALLELSPRARWTKRIQHAADVLKSFSVTVDPTGTWSLAFDGDVVPGLADTHDLELDLTALFVAVGEAAGDVGKGLVLLLDEVQFLSKGQLEALIAALHKMVQRKLPITLVGAGLPQVPELAGDAKSYAERLFKFPTLGNLDEVDARAALQEPAVSERARFEDAALDAALRVTGGYPYFIQELGYAVWTVAEGPTITAADIEDAIPGYEAKLDTSFFRVRLDRATELQRAYLRAMAELGDDAHKAADVAEVLGRQSSELGPTRAQLIEMGLLYTPEHGYAAFTVPHFDKFLKRAIPVLVIPPKKKRRKTSC